MDINERFLGPPSSSSNNLLEPLAELRETFTYVYQFIIMDIIKDTYKQLDKEKHKERSREVLSTGVSVIVELECATFLVHAYIHQTGSSPNLVQEFI